MIQENDEDNWFVFDLLFCLLCVDIVNKANHLSLKSHNQKISCRLRKKTRLEYQKKTPIASKYVSFVREQKKTDFIYDNKINTNTGFKKKKNCSFYI